MVEGSVVMNFAPFYRDTWVEVNLDAIYNNIIRIKKLIPENVEFIAVIKGNAYGHGAIQVSKVALEAGATRLAVALLDEALLLRRAGIGVPILVMSPTRPEDVNIAAENEISLTIFQKEWVERAKKIWMSSVPLYFHLKFDSGMGRIGIRKKDELWEVLQSFKSAPYFKMEGVYMHFATADEFQTDYFYKQYYTFVEQLSWMKGFGVEPNFIHAANSAATLHFRGIALDAVRIGIAMYGLSPSVQMEPFLPVKLEPALSFHTKIAHVKLVEKGAAISYDITYRAPEVEWIATVPVGYADGWFRGMEGFTVLIEGIRVPIVGRITMDQLMIRLPYKMPIGTRVTFIGEQKDSCISASEVASHMNTIHYEVVAGIHFRVPRLYVRGEKVVEVENYMSEL